MYNEIKNIIFVFVNVNVDVYINEKFESSNANCERISSSTKITAKINRFLNELIIEIKIKMKTKSIFKLIEVMFLIKVILIKEKSE